MSHRSQFREARQAYARLFAAGGPRFLVAGFVARLPTSMLPLALLLFAHARSGSFAVAGLVVAALSLGGAAGGPLVGAAAQRWGSGRALLSATVLAAAVLATLLILPDAGLPALLALAALLGASNGQVGALVRAEWSALLARPDAAADVRTALAYETVVDEASFVLGPAIAGTVAGLLGPQSALTTALALLVTQALLALLLHSGHSGRRPRDARYWVPGLARWLLLAAATGAVFGGAQTGLTARLSESDQTGLVGVVYAVVGVGSALSGALSPLVWARWGDRAALRTASVGLASAGGLLAIGASIPVLAAACLAVGLFVAPVQIVAFARVERVASTGATFPITLVGTAMVTGVAAGSAVAGLLADRVSPGAALLTVTAMGLLIGLSSVRVPAR